MELYLSIALGIVLGELGKELLPNPESMVVF